MQTLEISKEKAAHMQDLYERKYAINDLCILLASKNDLVEEGNLFYKRLINDNQVCMKEIDTLWNEIKEELNITLKENERIFLNFLSGEITIEN